MKIMKIKKTAVTITFNGVKHQYFLDLEHQAGGGAILPQHKLNALLAKIGVKRGQAYTVA